MSRGQSQRATTEGLLYGTRRQRPERPLAEAPLSAIAQLISDGDQVTTPHDRPSMAKNVIEIELPNLPETASLYECPEGTRILDCGLYSRDLAELDQTHPELYQRLANASREVSGLYFEVEIAPSDWPTFKDHPALEQAQMMGYRYDEDRSEQELIAEFFGDEYQSLPELLASEDGRSALLTHLYDHPDGLRIALPLDEIITER